MATKLSKIMTVFVAVASLTFMGFAFVNWAGGPNWNAEMKKLDAEYAFEYTPGENPTWAVTSRPAFGAQENVVTTPVLAKAVIEARKHQIARVETEIEPLKGENGEIRKVEDKLKKWIGDKDAGVPGLLEIDRAAMQARMQERKELIANLKQSLIDMTAMKDKVAQQAQEVRATVERRREDVYRLTGQYEDLQTDRFQILEQKKRLRDLLFRVSGTLDRLERRRQQLIQAGAQTANVEAASFPNTE